MSRAAVQYEFSRPTGVCAASGRALQPGEPCVAVLCEREGEEGFDRLDYAEDAWATGSRPPRLFSFWRTTVPEPHRKRRIFADDDLLMNLFDRLEGDHRPQRAAFRFVLALVLLRKRLLRLVGRREGDEGSVWLLERRGEAPGPPVEVIDPRLSDEDVRAVSDQLGEILQGDLE
jgi:hypothetical protein